MEFSERFRQRFERYISPEPMSGCWLWAGAPRNQFGHGGFSSGIAGKSPMYAHRVAYEMYVGPIPDGLIVRHDCDNPSCVNPAHLQTGTMRDNTLDAFARGRRKRGYGAKHAKAIARLVRETSA